MSKSAKDKAKAKLKAKVASKKKVKAKAKTPVKAKRKAKKPAAKRKGRGRPKIVITDAMIRQAAAHAANGLTMEQIAAVLGLGMSTLYEKANEYPDFLDAIQGGRAKGVAKVANALFTEATGGDVQAMKYYLGSRNSENWGENKNLDVNVKAQAEIKLTRSIKKPKK